MAACNRNECAYEIQLEGNNVCCVCMINASGKKDKVHLNFFLSSFNQNIERNQINANGLVAFFPLYTCTMLAWPEGDFEYSNNMSLLFTLECIRNHPFDSMSYRFMKLVFIFDSSTCLNIHLYNKLSKINFRKIKCAWHTYVYGRHEISHAYFIQKIPISYSAHMSTTQSRA